MINGISIIGILVLLFVFYPVDAQVDIGKENTNNAQDSIETNTDTATYIYHIKKTYRVLFYTGKNLAEANSSKIKIERMLGMPAELVYKKPNYKVYTGEFSHLTDAKELREIVGYCFEHVFVVPVYKREKLFPREKIMAIPIITLQINGYWKERSVILDRKKLVLIHH